MKCPTAIRRGQFRPDDDISKRRADRRDSDSRRGQIIERRLGSADEVTPELFPLFAADWTTVMYLDAANIQ